jgi:hypothetical protein
VEERQGMNWKQFTIGMVEALRWPAAFIAIAVILREPLTGLLHQFTGSL